MTTTTPNYSSGFSQWDPYDAATTPTVDDDPTQQPTAQPGQTTGNNTTGKKINWLSAYDALLPRPPIKYIVDKLISAGSVNVFYGEGGSKKTYALVDMGMRVAHGDQFLNFNTTKGPVLFIDQESGKARILDRMQYVLQAYQYGGDTQFFCRSLDGFDLSDKFWQNELDIAIRLIGAKLVIIDSLVATMPGKDENLVKDVQPYFTALRKIAEETNAAIVLIHHSNKVGGKNNFRGSSAIKGAVDLLVEVKSDPGKDDIEFRTEKSRDTEALNFSATINFMTGVIPQMVWLSASKTNPKAARIHLNAAEKYVLDFLLLNGASEKKVIENNANGCPPRSAGLAIYSLANTPKEFVIRTNPGAPSKDGAIYDLTDNGKNYLQTTNP